MQKAQITCQIHTTFSCKISFNFHPLTILDNTLFYTTQIPHHNINHFNFFENNIKSVNIILLDYWLNSIELLVTNGHFAQPLNTQYFHITTLTITKLLKWIQKTFCMNTLKYAVKTIQLFQQSSKLSHLVLIIDSASQNIKRD